MFAATEELLEAREYFQRALQLQPGFQPAIMSLAHVEEQAGNYDQAKKLYVELIDAGYGVRSADACIGACGRAAE